MNKVLIAPSILSADFSRLAQDIAIVEKAGADWLHIDVMDGHFVPNLTIGPVVVKSVRKQSKLLFDVHLMIDRPDRYWEAFKAAGADLITFHGESPVAALPLIKKIKRAGLKAGISIKPKSDLSKYIRLLPYVDLILVMTVEPGFGGQKFMEDLLPRIKKLRDIIEEKHLNCLVEVDGGINRETAVPAVRAGAQVLVAGNAIFADPRPVQALRLLRRAIDK